MTMSRWGDDTDYEAQHLKDFNCRFTINFKKIYIDVDEVSQRTLEVTDKHPKDSLMKLWAGTMTGIFIFMLLSYKLLVLAALPFLIFYVMALFRIYKCWAGFKYNPVRFWLMSIFTLIGLFALSRVVQYVIGIIMK